MQNSITSPITQTDDVDIEKKITVEYLVSEYRKIFGIDIKRLLDSDCREIFLCKCKESGFRFYYPFNIVGDSDFYNRLQANDWYYSPAKWEFEESINHINGGVVLEIGSANGDYLSIVRSKFPEATLIGLELNQEAARVAQFRGINVLVESTFNHAKTNSESYDVIASFQVLEHISNPMGLLNDVVSMLKPGGKLIIGVPNNSECAYPSLFVTPDNILNMPPHHQGLWDIPSLSYLQKVLPLKLEYMATEPATASNHSNSYRGLMKRDLMRRFGRFLGFLVYAIGRPYYDHALTHLNKYLPAHSILAVFVKIAP